MRPQKHKQGGGWGWAATSLPGGSGVAAVAWPSGRAGAQAGKGCVCRLTDSLPLSPPDAGKGQGDLHDLSVQQGLITGQRGGAVSAQRKDPGRTPPSDVPETPGPGNPRP